MTNTIFNSIFTIKLKNVALAQGVLALRRMYEDELDRINDYRNNKIISTDQAIKLIDIACEKYNRLFDDLWKSVSFDEQVQILSLSRELYIAAETGMIYSTPEMLSAARIIQ